MAPGENGTERGEREGAKGASARGGGGKKGTLVNNPIYLSLQLRLGNFSINGSVVPSNVHKRVVDSVIKSC